MPYVEKDVSRDQQAAQEMVRRSGQMGVPVITVDDSVVVGFDQPRLERLVASPEERPRLGASVAQRSGGLLVGEVHPGSPAANAGLQRGDLILAVDGTRVTTLNQLQDRLAASWRSPQPARMRVQRDGKELEVRPEPPLSQRRA